MVESDAILARILGLHPKLIDLSLDRMHRILAALGHPERKLPPVIHIAGTNGKGSTAAMICAGLEAMDKRVHVYTSPHLAWFHERIRLAGTLISEEMLAACLVEAERANAGAPITFFEMTTAVAFLAFSRVPADYIILEVGLGGRLDATNVITPALSIITPVSIDHEQYLGNTAASIAAEKAGIIKKAVPLIVGRQEDAARDVIEATATRLGAPAIFQDQDFQTYPDQGRMAYQDTTGLWDLPLPALAGPHQIDNAAMALAALRHFGAGAAEARAAMREVTWPARMQKLSRGPLVKAAAGREIWLDGGHNPAAGAMIARTLPRDGRPLVMICGMLNTKDVGGYLEPLAPLVSRFYGLSIEGEAATLSADETVAFARKAGMVAAPVQHALDAITQTQDPDARFLICGSLYLAGRVLRENGKIDIFVIELCDPDNAT